MLNRRRFLRGSAALAAGVVAPSFAFAQTSYLTGIDVSHWNGTVNWPAVKSAGVSFAICKATEGRTFVDSTLDTNYAAMKANGIYRSAYHFGRPATDPVSQARIFYNRVRPSSGDLPLTLDLEATDGLTGAQVRFWTQRFVAEIKRLMGRAPIIYTSQRFWRDEGGNGPNNFDCPLWVVNLKPDYTNYSPALPVAWSSWRIWQWSFTGTVPGVSGNCDMNVIAGNSGTLPSMVLP